MNTETKQEEKWILENPYSYFYHVRDNNGGLRCEAYGLKDAERIANLPVLEAENQQLKDINRELMEALEEIAILSTYSSGDSPCQPLFDKLKKKAMVAVARARTAGERKEK